jgi:hypothetical protein
MPETYTTTRLDHLGLVAAMCDELDLAGHIDARIVQESKTTSNATSPSAWQPKP